MSKGVKIYHVEIKKCSGGCPNFLWERDTTAGFKYLPYGTSWCTAPGVFRKLADKCQSDAPGSIPRWCPLPDKAVKGGMK